MAYDTKLADRIRKVLVQFPGLKVEEKKMFRGVTFMVDDKMCIGVSGDNLMCRFDPALQNEVAEINGLKPMEMRGKELNGYCYVNPNYISNKDDFDYWVNLCLDYNSRAKSSKKKK